MQMCRGVFLPLCYILEDLFAFTAYCSEYISLRRDPDSLGMRTCSDIQILLFCQSRWCLTDTHNVSFLVSDTHTHTHIQVMATVTPDFHSQLITFKSPLASHLHAL